MEMHTIKQAQVELQILEEAVVHTDQQVLLKEEVTQVVQESL